MVREELVFDLSNWSKIGAGICVFRCYLSGAYFKLIFDKEAEKILGTPEWRYAEAILIEHVEIDDNYRTEIHENVIDKGPLLRMLQKCSDNLKYQYKKMELSYQTDKETKEHVAAIYRLIFGKGEEKDGRSGND